MKSCPGKGVALGEEQLCTVEPDPKGDDKLEAIC